MATETRKFNLEDEAKQAVMAASPSKPTTAPTIDLAIDKYLLEIKKAIKALASKKRTDGKHFHTEMHEIANNTNWKGRHTLREDLHIFVREGKTKEEEEATGGEP